MLDKFLGELKSILESKDGEKLCQYLTIEPPYTDHYNVIIAELRQFYPSGAHERLEKKIESCIPEYEDGSNTGGSWPAFTNFLVQYFAFIRDIDPSALVETHEMIRSLLTYLPSHSSARYPLTLDSHSVLALSDSTMGVSILPTVIALSRVLSRLSIGLERHPSLLSRLKPTTPTASTFSASEATERITLVESSANTIREAFSKCLSERSAGGPDAPGPPAGRRVGIYLLANLCLRLFFHARKLRSAEQIFGNIYAQSPPLGRFPASQRVTFLYYLGRYLFANNHFGRAQEALQAAYDQCHARCTAQRRAILVPLVASNIILGRFPSQKLLSRPEAKVPSDIGDVFVPICRAIKLGDLRGFHRALDMDTPQGNWLLDRRVLLQIRNRCEVLVYRSLSRRVFLLSGFNPTDGKGAPRMDAEDLQAVVGMLTLSGTQERQYVDSDFEGDEDPSPDGNQVTFEEVESALASLVRQGLLHGYMSHKHGKFVITGAKSRPALEAGWPQVWSLLSGAANGEVPGWVTETRNGRPKPGGRVVNLSGAKPVGVGA